ncbi:hypothetical protein KBC86_04110 [Candidatus Gracilibacteria bacterium]|nr:hypothetical protein [Candidatus Gracilibacteria bacterium]
MSSQYCPDCHFYDEVNYDPVADNGRPPDHKRLSSVIVCTNIARINKMLNDGSRVIKIVGANEQVIGTPASVSDNCNEWQSKAAGKGIGSVLDRIIEGSLTEGYEFLGSKYTSDGRQMITIGCTLLRPDMPERYTFGRHTFSRIFPGRVPNDRLTDFTAVQVYLVD